MVGPRLLPQNNIVARYKMLETNIVLANTYPIFTIIPITTIEIVKDEDIFTLDRYPPWNWSTRSENSHKNKITFKQKNCVRSRLNMARII